MTTLYTYPPQSFSLAPSSTKFLLDGVVTDVSEDTVTPANNSALPSLIVVYKDGVQYPVSIDTGTPANTVGVPVILTGAAGPINITAGDLNVQLTDLGANFDASRIGDGSGNYVGVNASNQAKVIAADTDTALGLLAKLTDTQPVSIATMPTTPVTGTFFQATQPVSGPLTDFELRASAVPVSIASIALPTGASTEAKQDTGNTSLSSIDGKFTTLNAKDFATSAKQDTGNTSLSGIGTNTVNIPNVITTEGGAQPTHGVVVMGHTGAGIARHLLVDGTGRINTNVTASVLPTGASTLAEQQTQTTAIGSLTETAPATDTASSGLNGRLQRIAQRLTSLIALFPSSIGTKASADSLSVVLASDQVAIGVTPGTSSGAITQVQKVVGTSAVRATVAGTAPSATRKRLLIKPSKNNTGAIYLGSSSVTTSAGLEIIGPDRLEFLLDASDYYLISDSSAQVAEIIEVI